MHRSAGVQLLESESVPPKATVFDTEVAGPMPQMFILDSRPNFGAVVTLATDGNPDQMNYGLEYLNGAGQ